MLLNEWSNTDFANTVNATLTFDHATTKSTMSFIAQDN